MPGGHPYGGPPGSFLLAIRIEQGKLKAMSAAKPISIISSEDYLAGEWKAKRRHEYIAGRVYAMAGGKTSHSAVKIALTTALAYRLRGKRCQAFDSDTKVRIRRPDGLRFYYPDAMIVCQSNPGDEVYQDQPVVLAEVLSQSTRLFDEGAKRDDYLSIPSLSTYLLVETTLPRVTVYEREGDRFVPCVYDGLDAVIPLISAGISLPVAELYERVDFAQAERDERTEIDDHNIAG